MQGFKGKSIKINHVWRHLQRAPYFFIKRFWALIAPAVTGALCCRKPQETPGGGTLFFTNRNEGSIPPEKLPG